MRLAGLTAALALLSPGLAAAQTAAPAPLASGEVLLEIDSTGTARTRPDLIRLYAQATSHGETAAKARSLNAALLERLESAARSNGVAEGDVRRSTGPLSRMGFVGNEAPGWTVFAPGGQSAGKTESAMVEVRLRDPARVGPLRSALEAAGAEQVVGPVYALEDDGAARRSAREDAVRKARSEAEDYARALGLRVARILKVSDRNGGDPEDMEAIMALAYGLSGSVREEIETKVRIAVDFALAPTR